MRRETHQMIIDRENRELDLRMVRHHVDAGRLRQQMVDTHGEDYVFRLECKIYDEWLAKFTPNILKHGLDPRDYGNDPREKKEPLANA